jgi:hypothetical protein
MNFIWIAIKKAMMAKRTQAIAAAYPVLPTYWNALRKT